MNKKESMLVALLLSLVIFISACSFQKSLSSSDGLVQIATGDEFTLFLYNTGIVYAIGKNTSGQLGVGDFTDRYELTKVLLPVAVGEIGVSDDCAYALTKDGVLYAWGSNRYKQAGDIPDLAVSVPTRIPIKEKVKLCALGWSSTYAWTDSGILYGWGLKGTLLTYNYEKPKPEYEAKPFPQELVFQVLGREEGEQYQNPDVVYLASGLGSLLGIAKDGTFFGQSSDRFAVPFFPGQIIKAGSGNGFYVLLTREGALYLWGNNIHGELGCGDLSVQKEPQLLKFAEDPLEDIAIGPNHILAISKSGKLLAWGENRDHQLGLDTKSDVLVPTVVKMPEKIVYISTGFTQSYAMGQSGQLYAFGSNDYGQLRTGSQKNQTTPVAVNLAAPLENIEKVIHPQINEEPIKEVRGNKFLTESGKLFTIGTSYYAKLGTGNIDTIYYPPVYIPFSEKVFQVDENIFGVTVLTENGRIYNWGYNQNNVLGRDIVKWYYSPTLLPLKERIMKIHSGIISTAALSEKGNWFMWGDNEFGGLTTGDMVPVSAPVKINTPVKFIDIAPSLAHCLALTDKGDVYLWGNYKTSTGPDDSLVREVSGDDLKYKKVQLPEAITKIEAGDRSCYALGNTGNLYVWGNNESGVLGIGEIQYQEAPLVVLKDIKDFSLSPETRSILSVTKKGEVYIWGEMGYDKDLQILRSNTPQKISFPEKITDVFAGDNVFYAASQNTFYTWGYNYVERDGEVIVKPVLIPYVYSRN